MKTSENTESTIQPEESGVEVGGNSKAGYDCRCKLDGSKIGRSEVDYVEIGDDKVGKKGQKTFKSKKLFKSKKTVRSDFLTPGARLAFIKLR